MLFLIQKLYFLSETVNKSSHFVIKKTGSFSEEQTDLVEISYALIEQSYKHHILNSLSRTIGKNNRVTVLCEVITPINTFLTSCVHIIFHNKLPQHKHIRKKKDRNELKNTSHAIY